MERQIGYFTLNKEQIYQKGSVTVCKTNQGGRTQCVKIVRNIGDNAEQFSREKQIAELLMKVDHQNIIKFYDVQQKDNDLFLHMELGDFNLGAYMEKRNYSFSEKEIYDLLYQVSLGYLKVIELQLIHRDIKKENIIVTFDKGQNPIYKIIDFGTSKTFDLKTRIQTPLQSQINTSPESKTQNYDERCDIYSLGLIVLQMYDYKLTKDYSRKKTLDQLIEDNESLSFFNRMEQIPQSIWDILKQMICPEEQRMYWFELNKKAKEVLQPMLSQKIIPFPITFNPKQPGIVNTPNKLPNFNGPNQGFVHKPQFNPKIETEPSQPQFNNKQQIECKVTFNPQIQQNFRLIQQNPQQFKTPSPPKSQNHAQQFQQQGVFNQQIPKKEMNITIKQPGSKIVIPQQPQNVPNSLFKPASQTIQQQPSLPQFKPTFPNCAQTVQKNYFPQGQKFGEQFPHKK